MNVKYIFISFLGCVVATAATGCASRSQEWNGKVIGNDLIELHVVPGIGGRVIQYKLGGYGFFWVNPELVNTTPPQSGLGPEGEWLNYGGAKLWCAPQGWDNDRQWPGPPDAVLDGGPYALDILVDNETTRSIRLTSRPDKRSGIRFSRVITVSKGTTRVRIDATMKNIDNKPRRWGIWDHVQFDAGNRHGPGPNGNLWAYCPLNPQSKFHKGYTVQYGLVNNPSFKADYEDSMMQVHYRHLVGKVGVDSPAGWVATVDATDGYVFVHRFTYEPDKPYPDDSSVEFWMNGTGEFAAWGKINTMGERPDDIPYAMESEIISPYAALDPGEEYTFGYEWCSAKIPENSPVVWCNDAGVVCRPLIATVKNETLNLAGAFGVFHEGSISVTLTDARDNQTKLTGGFIVSPLEPLDMQQLSTRLAKKKIPDSAVAVIVNLIDKSGRHIAQLAKAKIIRNRQPLIRGL